MTFDSLDSWWWPYLFMTLAAVLPTAVWRWIGVFASGRIEEESEWLVFVRAMATALVAAVISKLILFPTGGLAETPVWLRLSAAALGFGVYKGIGDRVIWGVIAAEVALISGALWLGVF